MTNTDPHKPGVPHGMTERDVEQRAELAGYLGKEVWPATGPQLRDAAVERSAPGAVVSRLAQLPSGRTFANVSEVWQELSGGVEQQRF